MGLEHIGRVDRKQGLAKNGGRAVVSVVPHGEIYQALSVRNPAWDVTFSIIPFEE